MGQNPPANPPHSRFFGETPGVVAAALAHLERQDALGRLWRRDHTLWKPSPTEISDRLGWLTVADAMRPQVGALATFAAEVREAGFRHTVLLGMGGSSLGMEVLARILGSAPGYPTLTVLDSTLPERIQQVARVIDPARTLFLVSSKSGGTVETLSLYRHFRGVVAQAVGEEKAGRHFVAITDPGTSLETLGQQMGFRRVFLNPADIGGRYSVLSLFGLAPAALMGVDLRALLGRAQELQAQCAPDIPWRDNPGAWLGAVLGAMATHGRDKLTLACSPAIASFGLWVEQLIAESLGKEGKGIVPVVDEPMPQPNRYGADRLFVYARLEGDDNAELDARLERLAAAGQPVVCLEWRDRLDLASEYYRWEVATAVAAAMLGINPFDQPDVQGAKDTTDRVLRELGSTGVLPAPRQGLPLRRMLDDAPEGSYLAILAYLAPNPQVESALHALRRRVLERWGLAVTLGYGPRYLHSTGQLHKGGPTSGRFLLLTQDHQHDIPIPSQQYSFGALADAQALGDLTTLQGLGRPAVHRRLGADTVAGLERLLGELG